MKLNFCGRKILYTIAALFALSVSGNGPAMQARAGEPEAGDKTLSPYFFVKSDDKSIDQLPLKSTSVDVTVSGFIADIAVTQVYKNDGQKPIEAVYVFPASTRASVYGMKMTIGERTIVAQIQKREEARQAYEQAKQEGKSASLLEQERPNVFQMNVANIMPGDEIKTELHYTEIIVPSDNVYEFVYPTVVGPRHSNQPAATAPASEKWSRNPYLHQGEPPTYSFAIKARVNAGLPIQEMTCPSHKTTIEYKGKDSAEVGLDPVDRTGGNRDFILRYRLAGDKIASGLLLYEGKDENFFLLTGQPPKRVTPESMPPREYIFVVDVSGSMHGFPLEISKKLLEDLIGGLRPTDVFNAMTFSGGSTLLSERSLPASPENIRRAADLLSRLQGGGGTELLPAMQRVLALPRTENIARTIVIATDGFVTVEPQVFDLIGKQIGNANIFSFGIGTGVNRHLIEGMARMGAGEPFVITRPDEAPAMAAKFRKYIESPVLTHIKVGFGEFQAYDVTPSGVPDIFAERPAVLFGKWKGKPQGTITISGLSGREKYEQTIDVSQVKPQAENAALRYLWARARVAQLSDYNLLEHSDERIKEVTELGLKYSLLTSYTSFVAIDSEVRRKGGEAATVNQPLPLPEGVSDYALPGSAAAPMAMAAPSPWYRSSGGGGLKAKVNKSGGSHMALDMSPGYAPEPESTGTPEVHRQAEPSIQQLTVRGAIPEETVRRIVEQNLSALRQCFANASSLTLHLVVDKTGAVRLDPASNKGMEKTLLDCIRSHVGTWSFPAPKDGKAAHVTLIVKLSK